MLIESPPKSFLKPLNINTPQQIRTDTDTCLIPILFYVLTSPLPFRFVKILFDNIAKTTTASKLQELMRLIVVNEVSIMPKCNKTTVAT